jgi:hypothetical protein
MNEITTTDLADFGWRERGMAAELLAISCEQGFPDDFEDRGVRIMMNRNSGSVFFTNDEYEVCFVNPETGKLESWYYTPYHGHEGFANELKEMLDDTWNRTDAEFLRDRGVIADEEFDEWLNGADDGEEDENDEVDN